jgi:hypothetical protein
MRRWFVLLALVAVPVAVEAGPEAVSVEDFAWLTGTWEGTGLGGECEEVWSAPRAGAMLGLFRLFRDGEPVFYELLLLAEDEQGLSLKVKHFSPAFSAWEEKADAVRFGFESLEGHQARFRGLTLEREGDELRIEVSFRDPDGSTRVEPFELQRRP